MRQKEILSASESEREAKLAAAAAAKAEAEARAQAKAAAAERAKAEAEAKAADTGFDNMIENADQATALKEMVDKNAEIEAAAAAKQAATADYQAKLEAIENAETTADIDALISAFNEAHLAEYITGLDLTTLANAQKDILTADESERAAKQAAAAAAKAEADAAALAAKAEADAAAENKADLGSLLKNADKAEDLKRLLMLLNRFPRVIHLLLRHCLKIPIRPKNSLRSLSLPLLAEVMVKERLFRIPQN